jgi:dTDP-4-dehydrorhamnose reductase
MVEKVLLLGASGLLGKDLHQSSFFHESDLWAPSREELDVSDLAKLSWYLSRSKPDVVINAAAWTDVDGAEKNEEIVFLINAESVRVLADYALNNGKQFIQLSTASVFSGTSEKFFQPQDEVNPLNTYNKSKALAEAYCLERAARGADISVIRTYWLYGHNGKSFVDFVATNAISNTGINVVANQWGQPTHSSELATFITKVATVKNDPRIRHAVNSGRTSRLDLARTIYRHFHSDETLIVSTSASVFGASAPRPEACLLSDSSSDDPNLPEFQTWDQALAEYLDERYPGGGSNT